MRLIGTPIDGLFVIEAEPFKDSRGLFERLFCKNEFAGNRLYKEIVQINHSITHAKGAIRGLHFQNPPFAETKIVRCLAGAVFDVAVDLRHESPTFLNWHAEILIPENHKMLYIPEGFAHGFQVLEPNSELLYFHSSTYEKSAEGGVKYDDPQINIQWPLRVTDISQRDLSLPQIDQFNEGIRI